MEDLGKKLHHKVSDWLAHEGYPLEFRVAHYFRDAGFRVFQGMHIPDEQTGKAREIDVVGLKSLELDETSFYFVCLVECKWSKNKPWVLFSSSEKDSGGSSLISQTISSHVGEAVVHILAADEHLQKDQFFKSRQNTTYSGRVAFTKENDSDLFYSTVQSVISKSLLIAKADDPKTLGDLMPEHGSIVFPMIVIAGDLFEAAYNAEADSVELERRDQLRLRWSARGVTDHVINVVSFEFLEPFVRSLGHTASAILEKSKPVLEQLSECFAQATGYPHIPDAYRRYDGQPDILIKLDALQEARLKRT